MASGSEDESLRQLGDRIAEARKAQEDDAPKTRSHHSQAHIAWRMVIELVVGLLVGLGIGMGLDAVFGTEPFLLLLFVMLGFAAGVRVMMRTAKEIQTEGDTGKKGKSPKPDSEEDGRSG